MDQARGRQARGRGAGRARRQELDACGSPSPSSSPPASGLRRKATRSSSTSFRPGRGAAPCRGGGGGGGGKTMSTTSVSPSSPAGRRRGRLGDGLRNASSSCVVELLRHLCTWGGRPRARSSRPRRPSAAPAPSHELPVLPRRRWELVVVLRLRDGANARAGGRVAEPAADVAVDRLGHDPLFAETLGQDRHRHSPLPEPGIWADCARSEVACSTAWWTSCAGTSTLRRTVSPPSSSTCGVLRPFKQSPRGPSRALGPALRHAARSRRAAPGPVRSTSTPDRRGPSRVALARQDRTDVAAAHRHDHVGPGGVRRGLELPRHPAQRS